MPVAYNSQNAMLQLVNRVGKYFTTAISFSALLYQIHRLVSGAGRPGARFTKDILSFIVKLL